MRTLQCRKSACAALLSVSVSAVASAQRSAPVVDLLPVTAHSTSTFGAVLGVTVVGGNHVVVNDAVRHQLVMLDSTLSNPRVILDSAATGQASYGRSGKPFIVYVDDSLLFVDTPSKSFQVIDPSGKVARTMAMPKAGDIPLIIGGQTVADKRGNLFYRGDLPDKLPVGSTKASEWLDSAPLLRANFESRIVDTVARVKTERPWELKSVKSPDGISGAKVRVNPLVTIDDWTVTSNGDVAIVRGHDYHIDWITSDGNAFAARKMEYDWKAVTDDDKRALMDSARKAEEKLDAERRERGKNGNYYDSPNGRVFVPPPAKTLPFEVEFVPMREIADYYPAIRAGAVRPDMDGNVWILPTSSAQSKAGELIYDVVDRQRGLRARVRIPAGRSVAGFGRGGVVFLMGRTEAGVWYVEKAQMPQVP